MTTDTGRAVVPPLPSLPARVFGILTSPRDTFAKVVANPRWLGMLVLSLVVTVAASWWFLGTDIGRQALLDQQVASMESFGMQVNDAQYAQLQERLEYAQYFQAGGALIGGPIITFLLAGLLLGVFSGLLGGQATFKQVLAVVTHSGAVGILQQLFATPLNYVRESLSSPTNLSVFFPMLEEGSFLSSFLGTVDLFIVWWVVVLGIGLSVLYRRKTTSVVLGLFGVYAVIALAIAAAKAALGGQ
jgi:hypothetical protein